MTRQIIYSKLAGRPFTWEYKGYRKFEDDELNVSLTPTDILNDSSDGSERLYTQGECRAQSFKSPSGNAFLSEIWWYGAEAGSAPEIMIELWEADPDTLLPTSKVQDLGPIDWSKITSSITWYKLWDGCVQLQPDHYYAIVFHVTGSGGDYYNSLYLQKDSTAPFTDGAYSKSTDDGQTWEDLNEDGRFKFRFNLKYRDEFDYPDVNNLTEKRLEYDADFTVSAEVNGENVGTLTKEKEIPQATHYTVIIKGIPSGGGTIQKREKWLHYNTQPVSPEDFGYSEAYLLSVTYLEDGSVLRIDDDPNSQLQGDLNQEDVFADILIPWGKLEWRAGRGKILALGVF